MTRQERVAHERLTRQLRTLEESHRVATQGLGDLLDVVQEVAWHLTRGDAVPRAVLEELVAAAARHRAREEG